MDACTGSLDRGPALLTLVDLSHYQWLGVPAWVFDPQNLAMVWANAAGLEFWQAPSLAELVGRSFADLSESARRRLKAASQLHAQGITTREQWTLYPRGRPVTSILVGRGIRLADGHDAILFVSEPLASSYGPTELRGIAALQHTPLCVALHCAETGHALLRNPAAVEAFGPVLEQATGDELAAMFVDHALADAVRAHLRTDRSWTGQAELRTASGPRWHAVDLRPALDPVTGAAAAQVNALDITELKGAQAALVQARDAAEAANRAKSTFLANISHEIRTPMNGILGLTGVVLRSELDDRQRKLLEAVQQSARSLMAVFDDILDLSRLEAGRLALQPAPLEIRPWLPCALEPWRIQAEGKSLGWQLRVDDEVPRHWRVDEVRLRQILVNLVSNAVKFTRAGSIEIRLSVEGAAAGAPRRLLLHVHDSGIGIAPDQLARIFEPFVQADAGRNRAYGGTGLGLSIVRRLARLMGGDVSVDSHPGQGSRFVVQLPIDDLAPAPDA